MMVRITSNIQIILRILSNQSMQVVYGYCYELSVRILTKDSTYSTLELFAIFF